MRAEIVRMGARIRKLEDVAGTPLRVCPPGGCKLAVDSGTSLFTGPSVAVRELTASLRSRLGPYCDLSRMPTLTFRVGGTFTDFTSMPGPNPGISPHPGRQDNFSDVTWKAMNELVVSLPQSSTALSDAVSSFGAAASQIKALANSTTAADDKLRALYASEILQSAM